jgi:hypothetical protein
MCYFVGQSSEFCRHNPLCCFSVFIVVSVYFVIDSARKLLYTPSYVGNYNQYTFPNTVIFRHGVPRSPPTFKFLGKNEKRVERYDRSSHISECFPRYFSHATDLHVQFFANTNLMLQSWSRTINNWLYGQKISFLVLRSIVITWNMQETKTDCKLFAASVIFMHSRFRESS